MNFFKYYILVLLIVNPKICTGFSNDTTILNMNKSTWIDARIGFVGDLQGEKMNFPVLSLGAGVNYNTKLLLYSLRINYNIELVYVADAVNNTPLWDLGLLIGKNMEGGKKAYRKVTLSAGIGIIWKKNYESTGIYSVKEDHINTLGFVLEAKVYRVKRLAGCGFAAIANINSTVHYFGGAIYIPMILYSK